MVGNKCWWVKILLSWLSSSCCWWYVGVEQKKLVTIIAFCWDYAVVMWYHVLSEDGLMVMCASSLLLPMKLMLTWSVVNQQWRNINIYNCSLCCIYMYWSNAESTNMVSRRNLWTYQCGRVLARDNCQTAPF